MPVLRIDHIGVAVRNLDDAARKFKDLLGLDVVEKENVEDQGLIAALIPTADARFELLNPTSPESVVGRFIERRGEGVHHICFEVDDIAAEIASLKGREVQLVQGAPRKGFVGQVEFIHPRAAGGVLAEIAQVTLKPAVSTQTRLHHITVASNDPAETANAWKKALGMADAAGNKARATDGAQGLWLEVPGTGGKTLTEMVKPSGAEGVLASFLKDKGNGVFSIALEAAADTPALKNAQGGKAVLTPDEFLGLRVTLYPKA
jgi:methylmalonyl-CoA epimerase